MRTFGIVLMVFVIGGAFGFAYAARWDRVLQAGVLQISKPQDARYAVSRAQQQRAHVADFSPPGYSRGPNMSCTDFLNWLPPGSYVRGEDGIIMFRIDEPSAPVARPSTP